MSYSCFMNKSLFSTCNPVLLRIGLAAVLRAGAGVWQISGSSCRSEGFQAPFCPQCSLGQLNNIFFSWQVCLENAVGAEGDRGLDIRCYRLYIIYSDQHVLISKVLFKYIHLGLKRVLGKWVSLTYFFILSNIYCFL